MSIKSEYVYSSTGRQRPIIVRGDVVDFDTVDFVGEEIPAGTAMMSTVSPVEDIRAGRAEWAPVEGLKGRLYGVTGIRLIIPTGDMGAIKVTTEAFTYDEGWANSVRGFKAAIQGIHNAFDTAIAALA